MRLARSDATLSGLRLLLMGRVFPRVAKAQPWAGISEHLRCYIGLELARFQLCSGAGISEHLRCYIGLELAECFQLCSGLELANERFRSGVIPHSSQLRLLITDLRVRKFTVTLVLCVIDRYEDPRNLDFIRFVVT